MVLYRLIESNFKNWVGEHSVAGVPASLYNLTKSVPDPLCCSLDHNLKSSHPRSDQAYSFIPIVPLDGLIMMYKFSGFQEFLTPPLEQSVLYLAYFTGIYAFAHLSHFDSSIFFHLSEKIQIKKTFQ